jgi:Right handed beta helix region
VPELRRHRVHAIIYILITSVIPACPLVPGRGTSATIHVPRDYPTIQSAIDAASEGDVIVISPGIYMESVTLDKSVTVRAQVHDSDDPRNNTTILDGDGATVVTIPSGVTPGPALIGLVIRNGDDGISLRSLATVANISFVGNGDDLDYENGGGGICRDNVFRASRDDAIDLDHITNDLTIEGNLILHTSRSDDGIEIRLHDDDIAETAEMVIRNNEISGSGEDGIQIIDYFEDTNRRIIIERNLIHDVEMAGIGLMDGGVTTEDFRAASIRERIHVFHNTFVGNDHGISGGDNLIALNNIFQGHRLALKNVDGDSIASHNLFWNNTTDAQGSVVDAGTTLRSDPLLDATYRPRTGSPAIDAGTAYLRWRGEVVMNQPPSAYQGAAPDLGRHESSPPPTPPRS